MALEGFCSSETLGPPQRQDSSSPDTTFRSATGVAMASRQPETVSWSVTARAFTSLAWARLSSSAGVRSPSEAVLCVWKSINKVSTLEAVAGRRLPEFRDVKGGTSPPPNQSNP